MSSYQFDGVYSPMSGDKPDDFLFEPSRRSFGLDGSILAEVRRSFDSRGLPTVSAYATEFGRFATDQLTYLFGSAADNLDTRGMRQEIVDEFQALSGDEEARETYMDVMGFAREHHSQLERVYDPVRSNDYNTVYTPRIEQYARDRAAKDEKGNYLPDGSSVWSMPEKLTTAQEKIWEFTDTFGNQYPYIGVSLIDLVDQLPPERKFDVSRYIQARGKPRSIRSHMNAMVKGVETDAWLQNLADTTDNLGLDNIRSSEDGITFNNLSHAKFDRVSQELNSLHIDRQPIALTGRNGVGKTHLMEAIGLSLITGSTIEHAAISEGSMPLVDGIGVLYRPDGRYSNLSTHGLEAQQVGTLLEWLDQLGPNKVAVILADELFTGTDPEDQSAMYEVLVRHFRKLGAFFISTTHTDISGVVESGSIRPLHFVRDGDRKRLLVEGVGDSDAIAEAIELKLEPEITERAQAILDGQPFAIGELNIRPLRVRPSIKERYGDINPGLGWFIPRLPAEPTIEDYDDFGWRVRTDSEKARILRRAATSDTNVHSLTEKDFFEAFRYIPGDIVREILTDGSTTNEADVLARQEFFINLMGYEQREQLTDELDELGRIFLSLSSQSHVVYGEGDQNYATGSNPSVDPRLTLLRLLREVNESEVHDRFGYNKEDLELAWQQLRDATLIATEDILGNYMPSELFQALVEYRLIVTELDSMIESAPEAAEDQRETNIGIDLNKGFIDRLMKVGLKIGSMYDSEPDDDEYDDTGLSYYQEAFRDAVADTFGIFEDTEYRWNRKDPIGWADSSNLAALKRFRDETLTRETHGNTARMLRDLLDDKTRALYADELNESHYKTIARLKELSLRVARAGGSMRSHTSLTGLMFLAEKDDRIARIAGHYRRIGGQIGESLADYFETNIRQFFGGATSGREYAQIASKALRKTDSKLAQEGKDKPYRRYDNLRFNTKKLIPLAIEVFDRPGSGRREDPVTPRSEAKKLISINRLAEALSNGAYAPYVDSASIGIGELKNSLEKEWVPLTISYDRLGGIDVISGSNMSGKTRFGRALFHTVAERHSIGLVGGNNSQIPKYDKVLYLDRPTQKPGKGLSSFGVDAINIQNAVEILRDAGPSFIYIDEPFSTTSRNYQSALLLSFVEWAATRGHRVVFSTHNRDAINEIHRYEQSGTSPVEITFHNLRTEIDDDNNIEFMRQVQPGIAPSNGIAVAKKIGGEALARLFSQVKQD